ncbi:PIG-L family deacetylase [Arthrobacter sp. I2-34]|uniref:PIG-L family deacetylase n=1 Tax=Arthrobacter hankyongi TaxID=2904801 RepID=A0ABS9LC92_9MICC|nr:PIG-L family deacetylase [Arthrobacter hankyongi]MCG2624304.1 PIG-L family deacetylase [Arthrobacter hankyongi]
MNFRHTDRTSSEDAWRRWPLWQAAPPLPVTGLGHLIVVSAHPDDETLGAAGLILQAARCGARISVVVATDGEASHPASRTWTPDRLAAARRAELAHAVGLLGPAADVRFLGLGDGRLAARAQRLEAVLQATAGGRTGPGFTAIAAPWRGDGHPDHAAAGSAAAAAAAGTGAMLLEYPVWLWHWGAPGQTGVPWDSFRILRLDAAMHRLKAAAMAAHVTQVVPLSGLPGDEVLLGPEVLEHFGRQFESFILTRPAAAGGNGGG